MARFKKASAADMVHAEWWDSGTFEGKEWKEEIFLKPILTYELQQKATRLALNPPNDVSIDRFSNATAMDMFRWTDQALMERTLAEGMIRGWTFRYDPTEEQIANGEPGDLRPYSSEALAELDVDDMQFIMAEINARARSGRKAAEEAKPGFLALVPTPANPEVSEGTTV